VDKAKFFEAAGSPRTEAVDLPGFGRVDVREMVGDEILRVIKVDTGDDEREKLAIRVRLGVVAGDGSPAFTDDDLPAIRALTSAALVKIGAAFNRVNAELVSGPGGDPGNGPSVPVTASG